jgi:ribulose-5-phosphate 4-epimerase/fuculose-1-phosphate aldolase
VPDQLAELRRELALANRILAHEDVLDAFGHVSIRSPESPGRYFLSRSRSPALVTPEDILEFDLESQPVEPATVQLYAERVVHGEIYKARADVMAVCHHHAPSIMPFCISGEPLVPVFHLGAAMGPVAPFWDSRDEFGDTNLLVVKPAEGASLARALGPHAMVLMRRHGATVVGGSLREMVFRAVYSCDNARYLGEAKRLGQFGPLSPGEIERAQAIYEVPAAQNRAWEYWVARLAGHGGMPAPAFLLPPARGEEQSASRAGQTKPASPERPSKRSSKTRRGAAKSAQSGPAKAKPGKRKPARPATAKGRRRR